LAEYHVEYMTHAGGRILDFEALKEKYVDGDNIRATSTNLQFLNLTTSGSTLSEILKEVEIIVDETGHDFIASGLLLMCWYP